MANSKPVQNGEVRTEAVKYAYLGISLR